MRCTYQPAWGDQCSKLVADDSQFCEAHRKQIAYDDGFMARSHGRPLSDNPHTKFFPEWNAWKRGWEFAETGTEPYLSPKPDEAQG